MEEFSDSRELLRELFASQQLAVLATQNEGVPYSSLVAFAETDDLKYLVFVTGRNTRKYAYATRNRMVSVLVDSRTERVSGLNTTVAVTALGTIEEAGPSELNHLSQIYVSKHPHLTDFASGETNVLMKITITDYIIANFDNVYTLHIRD